MSDVESLWKAGLALGASLNNTIAIGENKVMNRDGLRYPHEFVRHKMLDAIGDLALAGKPLLAAYRSVRGGHRLNAMVLQALFADAEAWTVVQSPRVREQLRSRWGWRRRQASDAAVGFRGAAGSRAGRVRFPVPHGGQRLVGRARSHNNHNPA